MPDNLRGRTLTPDEYAEWMSTVSAQDITIEPGTIHYFSEGELERLNMLNNMGLAGNSLFGVDKECLNEQEKEATKREDYRITPKKDNKLKDWSINARALKSAIRYCLSNNRYSQYGRGSYKFNAVYDERNKIHKIWNKTTNNIVCTVKQSGGKVYIRYRENSHYAPAISILNHTEFKNKKYYTVPSKNLGIRRGSLDNAIRGVKDDKQAQLEYRKELMNRKLNTPVRSK